MIRTSFIEGMMTVSPETLTGQNEAQADTKEVVGSLRVGILRDENTIYLVEGKLFLAGDREKGDSYEASSRKIVKNKKLGLGALKTVMHIHRSGEAVHFVSHPYGDQVHSGMETGWIPGLISDDGEATDRHSPNDIALLQAYYDRLRGLDKKSKS